MKHELIYSVDEVTRRAMEQISEEISDRLNDALQSNEVLMKTEELICEMSGKADKILSSNAENVNAFSRMIETITQIKESTEQTLSDSFSENREAHEKNLALLGNISGELAYLQKTSDRVSEVIEELKQLPETLASVINRAQENALRELMGKLSEIQSMQIQEQNSLKIAITGELSKMGETFHVNQNTATEQIRSLDEKIDAISVIIENQNRNSLRLVEIAEKLDYLSLPFLKRLALKTRKSGKDPSDAN